MKQMNLPGILEIKLGIIRIKVTIHIMLHEINVTNDSNNNMKLTNTLIYRSIAHHKTGKYKEYTKTIIN